MDLITSIIVGVGSLCTASMIYTNIKNKQERKHKIAMETEKTEMSQEEVHKRKTLTTMAIVEGILTDLQCMPRMGDNGLLQFDFQGEHFEIQFNGFNAQFWNPGWSFVSVEDQNCNSILRAANFANVSSPATVVYTNPDSEGRVIFHSKRSVVVVPGWEGNDMLVRSVIDSLFQIQRDMHQIVVSNIHNQ